MSAGFTIFNSLDETTWREFVEKHPQGNIFHTPEMFKVFDRARGYKPHLWAVVDHNGQVQAVLLPVQVSLRNGLLHRLTTRLIAYGSVLCSQSPAGQEALASLLQTYNHSTARHGLYTELRNLSDLNYLQKVLKENGFEYSDHLDYLIDINCTPEQLLQNIGARTRKHIRQGLRRGKVSVEIVEERDKLPIWYDLVRATYQNVRVPLADRSLFEAAFDILKPRGMITFWLARIDSTHVAASAELLYKDVIYGWYGGVDRRFAADLPGEMLMWHILEWGAQHGYKAYDFGGAGKPNEAYGVRDFKAKFGGRLVCYGRNTRVHSPFLLRISTLGYRITTRRFGNSDRLPNPINGTAGYVQYDPQISTEEGSNEE